jgi:hypothetical protein
MCLTNRIQKCPQRYGRRTLELPDDGDDGDDDDNDKNEDLTKSEGPSLEVAGLQQQTKPSLETQSLIAASARTMFEPDESEYSDAQYLVHMHLTVHNAVKNDPQIEQKTTRSSNGGAIRLKVQV